MTKPKCEEHDVTFEVVSINSPEELVKAGYRACYATMKEVIAELRLDINETGLTWDQLEYLIDEVLKKEPHIVNQEHEQ